SFSNTFASSAGAYLADYQTPMTIRSSTFGETRSGAAAFEARALDAGGSVFVRMIGCTVSGTEPAGVRAVVEARASPASAVVSYRNSVFAGHGTELAAVGSGFVVSGGYNVIA